MSRYKSEQTAYSPLKKKYVPLWKLDTNTITVTHFNANTQTEESKTYHTDFIRYHLHYSDIKYTDRLSRLVDEGKIIQYLDDMEQKVSDAISRHVELWKQMTVIIGRLSSAVMPRKCSAWRTASSIWREKLYLSVWYISNHFRLCLRVQPFNLNIQKNVQVLDMFCFWSIRPHQQILTCSLLIVEL